jgi:CheY-like chemotaxis protein
MTTQAKILVVDDDPVVAKSFDRVLSGKGYAVITARDGPEALEKLASEHYDAVFTDIRMPGMDGLEVAARIKATQPWLPVVIVTGYGSPGNEARAKEIGVAGFLNKPLSPEMIEGSAREAMTRRTGARYAQAAIAAAAEVAAPAEPAAATPSTGRTAKDVALFAAAPFIGLAYALAFPFVGLALLVRYGYRALVSRIGTR